MTEELRVSITNERGLRLAGVVHLPTGKGKCPAVILLHGFTGYKEEEHNIFLARDLVKRGFFVLRFDTSGSGESEGSMKDDYRMTNYRLLYK